MECHVTSAASRLHLSATGSLDFNTSGKATPFYGSANPVFRSVRRGGKLPTLVLSHEMQRDALIQDRNKAALMLDMQAVHRIECDLRKLTNQILASRTCSGDAC